MTAMTRSEHLKWCKTRALAYVDAGDLAAAVASMTSDLGKHPDTEKSADPLLSALGFRAVMSGDQAAVRRWVEGFN